MIEEEVQARDKDDEEICVISHAFAQKCMNAGYPCVQLTSLRIVKIREVDFNPDVLIELYERVMDTNKAITYIMNRKKKP